MLMSFHHSLHLPLMSSLTSFSSFSPSVSLVFSKPTLAWTRCVIGNFRVSPALPLNDNLISPAAGPVSNDHLHLHLEWLAKGDKGMWAPVCVRVQGVWQLPWTWVHTEKKTKKKLDTDTQTAIFKQSWRQEADFDFSDFCSAEIVFGSGRKHWEISLPGQLEV